MKAQKCSVMIFACGLAAVAFATDVTWKSSVASGSWGSGSNTCWDGNYSPGSADTAIFNSDATVTIDGNRYITKVVINNGATVTFVCADGYTFYPKTFEGTTAEKVIMDGATFSVDGQNMAIPVTLEIKDGTTNTLKLGNKTDRSITISGDMTGSGTLNIDFINENKSNGVTFSGDNSQFSGTVNVINTSGQTDRSVFANAAASSANAHWNLVGAGKSGTYTINKEMLGTKPSANDKIVEYHFGSISNLFTVGNGSYTTTDASFGNSVVSCMQLYIGDDTDSSTAGYLDNATLHKVGSGTLTLSAQYPHSIYIDEGTLYLASSDAMPQGTRLWFNGEGATLATATNFDVSKVGSKQPLKGNTKYPICFSNGVDEVHTWATAIDSSNTAGFTKKGVGTLLLTASPNYSGTTTVKGGTLAIANSFNAGSTVIAPDDPASAAADNKVLFFCTSLTGAPSLASELKTGYKLVETADTTLTIGGTEYTGTAYSIAQNGTTADGIFVPASWLETYSLTEATSEQLCADRTGAGNGYSYLACYALGLDPNDANSTPKVAITQDGGNFVVSLAGVNVADNVSVALSVVSTTDLNTDFASYTPSSTSGTGSSATFTISPSTVSNVEFFKIKIAISPTP